jgi:hypothetical protein
MAKKKRTNKRGLKRGNSEPVHVVHNHQAVRSRLNIDKSDGIIAIMAAVLVTLIAILDKTYSLIAAVLMMIVFAAYKLIVKR